MRKRESFKLGSRIKRGPGGGSALSVVGGKVPRAQSHPEPGRTIRRDSVPPLARRPYVARVARGPRVASFIGRNYAWPLELRGLGALGAAVQ